MSKLVMINNYVIDVAIREEHTFESEVTNYPTESGANYSDNIRQKPVTVSMDGIVSNSPIGAVVQERGKSAGPGPAANALGALGATILPLYTSEITTAEAYGVLKAVWAAREPVTIRTTLDTFERMALTSLSIPRSKDTGDALHFTASFQQIQVVTNARVRVRTSTGGGGKRSRGPQVPVVTLARPILWRKGSPPGHSVIYDEEIIYYTVQSAYYTSINGPTQNGVNQETGVSAGFTGYQHSAIAGSSVGYYPLTVAETAAFKADLARAKREKAQEDFNRDSGLDTVSFKKKQVDWDKQYSDALSNPSKSAKTPVTSMSDLSRRQPGQAGFGRSPNYNPGNP